MLLVALSFELCVQGAATNLSAICQQLTPRPLWCLCVQCHGTATLLAKEGVSVVTLSPGEGFGLPTAALKARNLISPCQ